MSANDLKRVYEKLPFRDAVALHSELKSQKPLSQEMQAKLRNALRGVRFQNIQSI